MRQRPVTAEINLRGLLSPTMLDTLPKSSHTTGDLEIKHSCSHKQISSKIPILPTGEGALFISKQKQELRLKQKEISNKLFKKTHSSFNKDIPPEIKSQLKFTPTQRIARIFNLKKALYSRDFKSQPVSLPNSPKNSPINQKEFSLSQSKQDLFCRLNNIISDCLVEREKVENLDFKTKLRLSGFSNKTEKLKKEMEMILSPKTHYKSSNKIM
ncbi:unnamed protein product [Blepharisma stoltei]|uniref:Uncharacterized protein n=1 Tax=Blepharisma stoltei TaxID=1481888 RepID=A0AAU9J0B5_9CILI|nr:unnamed protein product [Blepharisma stoltei]